ncbi:MAG: S8 family serine peptidase [Verrucomicrobiota bacterium]
MNRITFSQAEDPAWFARNQITERISQGKGEGVKVAIIDTGVEASHPGLNGLRLADDVAVSMKGGRLRVEEGRGQDLFGHGTAVAGIIREVAPEVTIGSFRVLGPSSGGRAAVIREAVRFAFDAGYDILNCSFGCIAKNEFLPSFKGWVDEAYLRNCHVVAASNNEDSGTVEWPSHFPSVIGVTHVESGGEKDVYFRPGKFVEFGAQGEHSNALWLGGTRKRVLGSSFASPRMAGLLARLLSAAPNTSVLVAKAAMMEYAKTWPSMSDSELNPIPELIPPNGGQSDAGLYLS